MNTTHHDEDELVVMPVRLGEWTFDVPLLPRAAADITLLDGVSSPEEAYRFVQMIAQLRRVTPIRAIGEDRREITLDLADVAAVRKPWLEALREADRTAAADLSARLKDDGTDAYQRR